MIYQLNRENAKKNEKLPLYLKERKINKRILHIGVSAFFRAHLAMYTDAVNQSGNEIWGIIAVKTRSGGGKQIEILKSQDYLYSLIEMGEGKQKSKIIGAIEKAIYFPQESEEIIDLFIDESLAIITTTVTEKGYCFSFRKNSIDFTHEEIKNDLECLQKINSFNVSLNINDCKKKFSFLRTAIGLISSVLYMRYIFKKPGLTVLCCDNMIENGKFIHKAVMSFLGKVNQELVSWVDTNCTFPNAMVDRIVPAMTDESYKKAKKISGFYDEVAIICEDFAEWVIEDNFAGPYPRWEEVGVQIVKDVTIFEEMKLRMLNGGHSLLAYIGYLCGYETVDRAVNDKNIQKMLIKYWQKEAIPTLQIAKDELDDYAKKLLKRFLNPNLKHRTWQIAMDGSQKIPYRWLKGLKVLKEKGLSYDIQALGLAAWMIYTGGVDEQGNYIEVKDPLLDTFKIIHQESKGNISILVSKYLQIVTVFSDDLASDAMFKERIIFFLQAVKEYGIKDTVMKIIKR